MSILLIVIVLLIIFGGGGYWHSNFQGAGIGLGGVLLILLVLYLLGVLR